MRFKKLSLVLIQSLIAPLSFGKDKDVETDFYIMLTSANFEQLKIATKTVIEVSKSKVTINLTQNSQSALMQITSSNENPDYASFISEIKGLLGPNVSIDFVDPKTIQLGTQDDLTSL